MSDGFEMETEIVIHALEKNYKIVEKRWDTGIDPRASIPNLIRFQMAFR